MRKMPFALAALLAVVGICVMLWPVFTRHKLQADTDAAVQEFLTERDKPEQQYPELLAALQEYNRQLYAEKQCNLTDLEACEEPAADLTAYGIGDEIIGVLKIPAMELTMPVYLGASDVHLTAGAAVLGNTSAPIGGANTNSVIAGHRGWKGADYFRHIDRLQVGDTVTLTVTPSLQACIASGKSTHRMNALNGKDFPALPPLETEDGFTISQAVLREMIAKCSYAMATNDQRVVLNGCYFKVTTDNLLAVACDSFKLAKCSVEVPIENGNTNGSKLNHAFILPTKSVGELYRMLKDDENATVRVTKTLRNIVFHFDDLIFFSRLIDGLYIDYDRIIVTNHKITIKVDRDRLIAALDRAALVTEEKVVGSVRAHVRLELAGDLLKISAQSTLGETYDEVPIEHEGPDLVIAFNNRFLIDSLKSCSADMVKISLSSALTSINIEPAEDETIHELFMLLPVRMKE